MKRQELLQQAKLTERTLRSFLSQIGGIDIDTKEIPDELAEKLINGQNQSSQPKTEAPQLNQGAPASSLEELQQINSQNLVAAQQLEQSALVAEVNRMGDQGAYVGAMAVAAYQQNLLRQIAAGLGEWSQVAIARQQQITAIPLSEIQALPQIEAQKLIAENFSKESPRLLTQFAPGTLAD